jgi:hypothetical protein
MIPRATCAPDAPNVATAQVEVAGLVFLGRLVYKEPAMVIDSRISSEPVCSRIDSLRARRCEPHALGEHVRPARKAAT